MAGGLVVVPPARLEPFKLFSKVRHITSKRHYGGMAVEAAIDEDVNCWRADLGDETIVGFHSRAGKAVDRKVYFLHLGPLGLGFGVLFLKPVPGADPEGDLLMDLVNWIASAPQVAQVASGSERSKLALFCRLNHLWQRARSEEHT